jgi:mRNA-degrading endonuclease toxin of MazEF toxin-antitoxin module
MSKDTMLLTEQLTAIDTNQILSKAGYLSAEKVNDLNGKILQQLGIRMEEE